MYRIPVLNKHFNTCICFVVHNMPQMCPMYHFLSFVLEVLIFVQSELNTFHLFKRFKICLKFVLSTFSFVQRL